MTSPSTQKDGLLVCPDLFFTSKVTGTADALGLQVDVVDNVKQAAERFVEKSYGCVLLDLSVENLEPADLLAALPADSPPPVVAFGSHVDAEVLERAETAGCDEVMPRSKFSMTLPEILERYLKTRE